jgi:hypothetical protein
MHRKLREFALTYGKNCSIADESHRRMPLVAAIFMVREFGKHIRDALRTA